MDAGARNFMEALLGRAPLEIGTNDPLSITADITSGIKGTVDAGSTIEAINLSTAPSGRLHLEDTVEIGKADAAGKFTGNLPDIKEGDIIRLRERKADGTVGDWVTIRAAGVDKRNAEINLERFDVLGGTDGTVEFKHNTGRPLSEPGAQMRLVNKRTGESKDFTFDDKGSLAAFKLSGKPGDEFSVAITDGKNNTNFAEFAGVLKVPGTSSGGGVDLPTRSRSRATTVVTRSSATRARSSSTSPRPPTSAKVPSATATSRRRWLPSPTPTSTPSRTQSNRMPTALTP
jgi:hypothetical protein